MTASALPKSVDGMLELLTSRGYLAERSLATVTYLSLRMGRPLFLEGEAGVGKTEIAKVLSAALGRKLIRLQCYEGLDVASAVYEWSSAAQMIAIRLAEAAGDTDRDQLSSDIFAERFLIKRPLLQARICWKFSRTSRSRSPNSAPSRLRSRRSSSSPRTAPARSTTP
jgi:MoxR-like ATPase